MNRLASAIVVLFLGGFSSAYCAEADVPVLQRRYASATSEAQRVQIAMDAINAKVICRGCNVEVIDKIFSTDFRLKDPNSLGFDDKYTGTIYFDPPKDLNDRNSSPERARAYRGWYLGLKYDKNGELVNYYLTNIHNK